ncbi:MAG: ribulose-phosphate 3-epimerase [Planctomycetota bacterium]
MTCRRDHFLALRHDQPHVLPSLLSADFGNLEREVRELEAAGVRCVHLDVMDGCFVPNLTFGFPILEGLRKHTDLLLDVHLMIQEPVRYVERFCAAGADCLTVHVEAVQRPREVLRQVRDLGVAAGITLNPDTPMSTLDDCWDLCDLVLVMSVPAGFGGQEFHEVALEKLSHARECVGDEVLLEVDGGVNAATIQRCAAAGARLFVVGTAVFQSASYGQAVQHLKQLASSG